MTRGQRQERRTRFRSIVWYPTWALKIRNVERVSSNPTQRSILGARRRNIACDIAIATKNWPDLHVKKQRRYYCHADITSTKRHLDKWDNWENGIVRLLVTLRAQLISPSFNKWHCGLPSREIHGSVWKGAALFISCAASRKYCYRNSSATAARGSFEIARNFFFPLSAALVRIQEMKENTAARFPRIFHCSSLQSVYIDLT